MWVVTIVTISFKDSMTINFGQYGGTTIVTESTSDAFYGFCCVVLRTRMALRMTIARCTLHTIHTALPLFFTRLRLFVSK